MLHSRVVVIGGGVAGIGSALEIARRGYPVTLVERDGLLQGTSNRTPGRLGMGFHYATSCTAAMLFDATIDFVQRFPDCTLGREYALGHPLRRAQYFIARESLFAASDIEAVQRMLVERYARAWKASAGTLPFGHPGDFLRSLDAGQYASEVDASRVTHGVDTAEVLMDWPKVRSRLLQLVLAHPLITVRDEHAVVAVERRASFEQVVRCVGKDGTHLRLDANIVVNCSWQNIDAIRRLAGFAAPSGAVNRLKALIEVVLPPSLATSSSKFFCMGPFAMFSNMNNGRGMMTYAPVTNIATFTEADDDELDECLRAGVSASERRALIEGIMAGVSGFIPAMASARPMALHLGVVRTRSECDIHDRNSDIHHRDYTGVAVDADDFINNAATKLIYFARNADCVADRVEAALSDSMAKACA